VFNMPARLGAPRELPGLGEALRSPIYATAVGLLRYAAEQQAARDVSMAVHAVGWWRRWRRRIGALLRW
jgi:cell division protein FtsA